jgi:hypothetical protein
MRDAKQPLVLLHTLRQNDFHRTQGEEHMKCNCHPDSPFHWRERTEPSIFAKDLYFMAKGAQGLSGSHIAAIVTEDQRKQGKPDTLYNVGKKHTKRSEKIVAYKHFGVYSAAAPSKKKPNKHEA